MSESKKTLSTCKTGKLVTGLITSILLLLSMGCSISEKTDEHPMDPITTKQEGTAAYVSPFREVNGPVHTTYLIANPPIEINTSSTENPEYPELTLSIKGLQDKAILEKINRKIMDHHNSLKEMDMPPYRGIRRLIPEGSELLAQDVSTHLIFSAYDIISVMTYCSKNYNTGASDGTYEFIDYRDALTLDLHTGEEIQLADLFVSDADYLQRLNMLVSDHLSHQQATEEYGKDFQSITLTRPFTGLKWDQKFSLTENALALIFDFETPEFDTRNYPVQLNIPYKDLEDILAIKERFYQEESSIYENKKPREHILIGHFQDQMEGENSITSFDGIDAQKEMKYPANLISSLKEKFIDFSELNEKEIESINQEDAQKFYFQESTVSYIGDFIIFSKMTNFHDGKFNFTQEYKTFREDGTIVTLDSLFKSEYEYEEVIRTVLLGAIPRGIERNDELVDTLMESLTFRLSRTDLYFATESIEVGEEERTPVSFGIPFKVIGAENLTIFE